MTESENDKSERQLQDLVNDVDKLVVTNSCRDKLKSYLGSLFKIEITDGRTILGGFVCTDHAGNIILEHSLEYMPGKRVREEPKFLGLALVPSKHVISILKLKSNNPEHSAPQVRYNTLNMLERMQFANNIN